MANSCNNVNQFVSYTFDSCNSGSTINIQLNQELKNVTATLVPNIDCNYHTINCSYDNLRQVSYYDILSVCGLQLNSSPLLTDVVTGSSDNSTLITLGYFNDNSGSGGASFWSEINIDSINTTPPSTTTITTISDLTGIISPEYALKYKISDVWYYGYVRSITSNLIIIAGESLSGTIQEIKYAKTPYIGGWNILPTLAFYGSFADADNTTLVATDILTQVLGRTNFKLIGARFFCTEKDSAAAPDAQAAVTVINSTAIFTAVELVDALTWYYTTIADSSYTAMSNSQAIEISVTAATGTANKDAKNLTVEFYCVKTDLE